MQFQNIFKKRAVIYCLTHCNKLTVMSLSGRGWVSLIKKKKKVTRGKQESQHEINCWGVNGRPSSLWTFYLVEHQLSDGNEPPGPFLDYQAPSALKFCHLSSVFCFFSPQIIHKIGPHSHLQKPAGVSPLQVCCIVLNFTIVCLITLSYNVN